MRTLIIAITSLIFAPVFANAQDGQSCESAIELHQNTTYQADTTSSVNSIGAFGGLPSPGNDLIYTFTWNLGDSSVPLTIFSATYNFGVFLVPTCIGSTTGSPIQAATGPSNSGSFQISGLTPGARYYIVVSGNPSVNSPLNGSLVFSSTQLPVTLQTWSIE